MAVRKNIPWSFNMRATLKKGNQINRDYFNAIQSTQIGGAAPSWEVIYVDRVLSIAGVKPDWVLINRNRKLALVMDLSTDYHPAHFKKGTGVITELENLMRNPSWEARLIDSKWMTNGSVA